MSPSPASATPPLSAEEAEAIATAVALHHLRASQAGTATARTHEDLFSNWARESLLTNMDKSHHRMTSWGLRTWG
jgi:hypothetical protein